MAIREYCEIDTKRYRVAFDGIEKAHDYPKVVDRALSGTSIVWKAPGTPWKVTPMLLIVLPTDTNPWGTVADIKASHAKGKIAVVENNDAFSYNAVIMECIEQPISPGLNEGSFIRITLQEAP